jgi:hypothetical protein
MSKSKQFPFAMPEGMPAFPGFGKESFEWMSNAFSDGWETPTACKPR